MMRAPLLLALSLFACGQSGSAPEDAGAPSGDDADAAQVGDAAIRVLAFSRTLGFRHDSIPAAQAALRALDSRRFEIAFSEDPAQLVGQLPSCDVVLFLLTSGDVLDAAQERALEVFLRAGGGFVGVHSATDTEHDSAFYTELLGARFASHPVVQPAVVTLEAAEHPSVAFLPARWEHTDEWYNFDRDPRSSAQVLLRVDESSYAGGTHGADHPIAWYRTLGQGRALYTGLGHTSESWSEPLFVRHVVEALRWAAQRTGR